MSRPSPVPPPLLGRIGRVKGWALRLMFGGGSVLALLTLLLPAPGAPNLPVGQLLFLLTAVMGLGVVALTWQRPGVLRSERFDTLFMVLGNVCAFTSSLGEALLFGTSYSEHVALWPMVFAAGFLGRRLLRTQAVLTPPLLALAVYSRSLWVTGSERWWLEALVLAVPVVITGLIIGFFRAAAEDEAEELTQQVGTDPLTGLANRRALHEDFGRLLARLPPGHRVAVIMLDLDHFKLVNDRYGHRIGDDVLRCFAGVLRSHAQPHDLLVRVGGEEFVWVTAEAALDPVMARVEAARAAHAAHPDARAVTVSAGLVCHEASEPLSAGHLDDLLGRADAALYAAKAAGRNCLQLYGGPRPVLEPA
ncbi:GGDEF domain-containing protein [Deinococcus aquaedulcis]|uniref:GGDEF domain-containing protein n=1 Tax=Deinococcus aquaedulcis TaxID=2840455 RepID=UPI001C82E017|nr:GGDEF domain-containing protein [Deinococcus aquaedulcis]